MMMMMMWQVSSSLVAWVGATGAARELFVGEAEKLFKMVGQAMAVLGDARERRRFDTEEAYRARSDSSNQQQQTAYARSRSVTQSVSRLQQPAAADRLRQEKVSHSVSQ
jgi:curved DNA-binding protein CbpA